jgi:hypothetical protein
MFDPEETAVFYEEQMGSPSFESVDGRVFRHRVLRLEPCNGEVVLYETLEMGTETRAVAINNRSPVIIDDAGVCQLAVWYDTPNPNVRRDEAGIDFVLRRLDRSR